MNKGAAGGGAAPAAGQKQRALLQRADADINNLVDNFLHLIKASRINDPVRNAQEGFQMDFHASRVVQAADSLLKLVSELKQSAVFSDFISLNEHIEDRISKLKEQNEESERLLVTVGEQVSTCLRELQGHCYNSLQKKYCGDGAAL